MVRADMRRAPGGDRRVVQAEGPGHRGRHDVVLGIYASCARGGKAERRHDPATRMLGVTFVVGGGLNSVVHLQQAPSVVPKILFGNNRIRGTSSNLPQQGYYLKPGCFQYSLTSYSHLLDAGRLESLPRGKSYGRAPRPSFPLPRVMLCKIDQRIHHVRRVTASRGEDDIDDSTLNELRDWPQPRWRWCSRVTFTLRQGRFPG